MLYAVHLGLTGPYDQILDLLVLLGELKPQFSSWEPNNHSAAETTRLEAGCCRLILGASLEVAASGRSLSSLVARQAWLVRVAKHTQAPRHPNLCSQSSVKFEQVSSKGEQG